MAYILEFLGEILAWIFLPELLMKRGFWVTVAGIFIFVCVVIFLWRCFSG